MRRLFWLVAGVTVGVLVVRKLQATAEKMTASSIGRNVGEGLRELAAAVGDFAGEVRVAMKEQEAVLREGAGLDAAPAAAGPAHSPAHSAPEGTGAAGAADGPDRRA